MLFLYFISNQNVKTAPKSMMFLALNHTYQSIQVALFDAQNPIQVISIDKLLASKEIIVCIDHLLANHQKTVSDLSFIAINQGPGPFTTLRTTITTANGICFAAGIPLVGVHGLETFLAEYKDSQYPVTVGLLNAFSNDVYFGIDIDGAISIDCWPIETLLHQLKISPYKTIRCIGAGVTMHQELIKNILDDRAYIPSLIPETVSIEAIASQGLKQWNAQENISSQLQPLYLKQFKLNVTPSK
jgi:tRNA threonylcarbamoyladenosine biosynthesis protein TsaB